MIFSAFRGIAFKEALEVVNNQKYVKQERRDFQNGLGTREVFGPGIYFINDIVSVTFYAFCHAEKEKDLGAVTYQKIEFENPLVLNQAFGEKQLRLDALQWKLGAGGDQERNPIDESLESIQRMGGIMKEYVIHLGYDGIIYHIDEHITYYISYFPERQVKEIQMDLVFHPNELASSDIGSE